MASKASEPTSGGKEGKNKNIQIAESTKIVPSITEAELRRFIDLGLGRGLNATDLTPWLNKSSFQVRQVSSDNIIWTDEGGAAQRYETEVQSTFTLQVELQASIAIPQSPITIGVDAEQSRSVSSSRKSCGRKVLNRTISYRADFDDVPTLSVSETDTEDGTNAEPPNDSRCHMTFEERLCNWILHCIEADEEANAVLEEALRGQPRGNAAEDLPRAILHFPPGEKRGKLRLDIENACKHFARTFNITHYVCALHLGASEYCVFTEEQYQNQMKTKASVGVDQIGERLPNTCTYMGVRSERCRLKR